MTTAEAWVDETRDLLLSGYVEELLVMGASASNSDTQLTITEASDSGIVPGIIIEVDSPLSIALSAI